MTGSQLGIATDGNHTKAKILSISTERIRSKLDEGNIVVACGFQGINSDGEITTLGRGGSDTSAVCAGPPLYVPASVLSTRMSTAFTRRTLASNPEPAKFSEVSFEEMLELAGMGAGVDAQPLDRNRQAVWHPDLRTQQL